MKYSIPVSRSLGLVLAAVAVLGLSAADSFAAATKTYRVTITNLMPNTGTNSSQILSTPLVVVHSKDEDLWSVGQTAPDYVVDIAEDAITTTATSRFSGERNISFVGQMGTNILPGSSVTFEIEAQPQDRLTVLSMLVNTNDAFTGLDAVRLQGGGKEQEYLVKAYDAGSEVNDQLIANIPGPCCNDAGRHGTPETGVITLHPGILASTGDLDPALYGWPSGSAVARITIERVK